MSEFSDPRNNDANATTAQSLAVVTLKNFLGGIIGGGAEAVVGYPLETVKARMQTQPFTGSFDCFTKSVQEGGLMSLYRGVSPQIFRSAMGSQNLFPNPKEALIAAGIATGLTEGMAYTPFEVVKVRMQTVKVSQQTAPSNWQCVKHVYRQNGIKGLYRGFWPTSGREMLGNVTYFLIYETTKEHLVARFVDHDPNMSPEAKTARTYQSIAFAGGCAGFMYWLVVFPIDTIKSVLQADRLDTPRFAGITDCCRQLAAEGGLKRFYRGITPSLLRAFPANAVTFVAFEKSLSLFNQLF